VDRIVIRDLAVRCILGVGDEERRDRQDVLVSLAVHADLRRAAQTDAFTAAVDYRAIKKRVLALVEASAFHLLEALAEAIAHACLSFPGVDAVQVTVDKPGALRFARSVAVEITRTKEEP
jgi:FolB domain-containing protein